MREASVSVAETTALETYTIWEIQDKCPFIFMEKGLMTEK